MVLGLMDLKDGNMRRSFPNRNGCVGYAVAMYLLSVICAWSCNDVTVWKSRKAFMSVDDVAKTENTKKLACFQYIFLVKQLDTVFIVYNVCHRLLTLNDCFSLCLCLCLYFYLCLFLSPVLKMTIPLRQANSVGSTCISLNLVMISCNDLISVIIATTFSGGDCSVLIPVNHKSKLSIKQETSYFVELGRLHFAKP